MVQYNKIHVDNIIETPEKVFVTEAQKNIIDNIVLNPNQDLSQYALLSSPEFTGTPSIKNKGAILSESTVLNGGYF